MHSSQILASFLSLAILGLASLNSTREFKVSVSVQPGQAKDLDRFNGLQLTSYHSGAGLGDGVFLTAPNGGNASFNVTDPVVLQPNGEPYYNLIFDFGNPFPWTPQIEDIDFYAAWLPVGINAGNVTQGAVWFLNSTGLQVTSSPTDPSENGYGGWLVCDWYRGVPELFAKIDYYNYTTPSNCANANLIPEYI